MDQQLYEDQFSESHNFLESTAAIKTLVIASTPRSGSHFLGHALHKTGHFGFPLEYANPKNLKKWEEVLGVKGIQNVLEKLQSIRTSPNGVFAIKSHYTHLQGFGGLREFTKLVNNPYFVLLTRQDILKQAISLSIARQTGVWISGQQAKSDALKYDEADITYCLKRTILHNASWKYLLASSNVKYMEVSFEEAKTNLANTVRTVANFMEMDIPEKNVPTTPATKKQSNSVNEEWEDRFRRSKHSEMLLDLDLALGHKSKKRQLKELLFN
ncbi:Stf0 family sulfotransferase [Alteromonas gracilis]|uniref:Stf0 family sulfotransferase n=1 Tax=Alteromonas gracilis TaxID=1479524 RepID=UPI00373631C3